MTFWSTGKGNPTAFWEWFIENHHKYLFLNEMEEEVKDQAVDDLLDRLHTYSEDLHFEVGAHPDNYQMQLVISANGSVPHFGAVERLVDTAPHISPWRFVKFRQPRHEGMVIRHEGREFDPEKIVFLPLSMTGKPDAVAVRVCYPDYTEEENTLFVRATYLVLFSLIGERAAAFDIDYLDVVKTPDDIDEDNFPRLDNIAQYIEGRKIFKYPGDRFDVIEHTDDNGYLTFITANFAYKGFAFKHEFPWFVRVTLPLRECNENGHPTEEEAEALNSFEDHLESILKARSITHYIGRTTLYKKRELLYYVSDPVVAKAALEEVTEESEAWRKFQFAVENDAAWRQVAYFLEKAKGEA
jgi:hypothetical protein